MINPNPNLENWLQKSLVGWDRKLYIKSKRIIVFDGIQISKMQKRILELTASSIF